MLKQSQHLTHIGIQRRRSPQRERERAEAVGKSDTEQYPEIREESASNSDQCLLHLAPKGSKERLQRNGGSHHTILQCVRV